jgi:probable phosphoglycerate mutase
MPLYLVRHGETDWNREKRFQASTDVPLNATGLAQAAALRAELAKRGVRFCAARCSPLSRAVETARIVLEGSGVQAVVEPAFIELRMGDFEGRLESELRAELGCAFDQWRAAHYTIPAPGDSESIISGAERVRQALMALEPLAAAGDVLVVAHQAVNMAMKVAMTGKEDIASAESFKQNNDEIDIWDLTARIRLEKFQLSMGAAS